MHPEYGQHHLAGWKEKLLGFACLSLSLAGESIYPAPQQPIYPTTDAAILHHHRSVHSYPTNTWMMLEPSFLVLTEYQWLSRDPPGPQGPDWDWARFTGKLSVLSATSIKIANTLSSQPNKSLFNVYSFYWFCVSNTYANKNMLYSTC